MQHSEQKHSFLRRGACLLAAALIAPAAPAALAAEVMASFKPLHSLVQGVMGDTGSAEVLIAGVDSPHHYNLKPSQVRALHNAKVVFYLHDNFEGFLPGVLEESKNGHAVADAPGMRLLEPRGDHDHDHGGHDDHDDHDDHKDDHHDEHDDHDDHHDDHKDEHHDDHDDHKHGHDDHDDHAKHDDHDDHVGEVIDWHVWTDPRNAKAMVRHIETVLSAHFPQNSARYAQNSATLQERLDALDDELADTLAPVKNHPYLVFHDAYQYMEKHYGLMTATAMQLTPNLPPSAKQLREARHELQEKNIRCAFREPQFSDKGIRAIAGDTIRIGVLDPVGGDLPAGAAHYFETMRALANNFRACFAPTT